MPPALIERAALAFLVSAGVCLALGPSTIKWLTAQKFRQPFRHEDCPPLKPLHEQKQGTPTMGGLFVLAAALAAALLCGAWIGREGALMLLAVVGLGLLGGIDDWQKFRLPNAAGLPKRLKLLVALALGAAVGVCTANPLWGYRELVVPWMSRRIDAGMWWVPLSMGVVAGSAHAVNLTDGMDGLAAGLLVVAFAALGVLAGVETQAGAITPMVMMWCACFAGACAAFLWFNSHPAAVFMGDVGALGLGAGLGTAALLSHQALGLLLIGGVFVAEAGSVMLQVASYKWRNKRRIFRVAPLHHHVELGGVGEQTVVARFWVVGLLLAAAAVHAMTRS